MKKGIFLLFALLFATVGYSQSTLKQEHTDEDVQEIQSASLKDIQPEVFYIVNDKPVTVAEYFEHLKRKEQEDAGKLNQQQQQDKDRIKREQLSKDPK